MRFFLKKNKKEKGVFLFFENNEKVAFTKVGVENVSFSKRNKRGIKESDMESMEEDDARNGDYRGVCSSVCPIVSWI